MKYLTNSGLSYFLNKIKAYIASQLNSKASVIHTHTKSDIIDLPNGYVVDSTLDGTSSNAIANSAVVDALDGKSNTGHTHTVSDVTDFPTLATVATSGSYNDLTNKPTIPTVNNATLKIQKNGTDIKTFTANASSNVTCNITVPTKVSELTNDSGFLTSHQSLSGYVPRSGGAVLTNDSIGRTVNTNRMVYCGGADNIGGASITLYGKDSDSLAGVATMQAYNGTNNSYLRVFPTGEARFVNYGTTKNIAMAEDVVPRSGGSVLSGQEYKRTVDNSTLNVYGGQGYGHGAFLQLTGKDDVGAGEFNILAHDGTNAKLLKGKTNGTLTWANKEIDTIEEQGNNYIRYSSGLQICWAYLDNMQDSTCTWSFPRTFSQNPVITATVVYTGTDGFNKYQRCVELNNISNTSVLLRAALHTFTDTQYVIARDTFSAIAIGRWK